MRTKYDVIIGIDPDKDKSGVAELHVATKEMTVTNLSFPLLLDYLLRVRTQMVEAKQTFQVVVEAGWFNKKSCFHTAQGKQAEKIAKDVGANHETGRKIVEMCKHWGIEVMEHAPLVKDWKGKDRKISAPEFEQVTGVKGRTNQDGRDAGLLAWVVSGLPIRLHV